MISASLVFHAGPSHPTKFFVRARGFPALSVDSMNLKEGHSSNRTGLSIYHMWSWLPIGNIASLSLHSIELICPIGTCAPLWMEEKISERAVIGGWRWCKQMMFCRTPWAKHKGKLCGFYWSAKYLVSSLLELRRLVSSFRWHRTA